MFSRVFKSKKDGELCKKDKQISLVVENNASPQEAPVVAKVSRSLLVKHSPVFKKMAEKGTLKKSRPVKMKGVTVTGVQKMIEYITTESVFFLTHYEVIETLKAAYVYQVLAVNEICSNFLITVLNSDNACDIYEFAAAYSFHQVEFHCLQLIDRLAERVLKSPGFLTLKRTAAEDIVKRQSLNIHSEAVVFGAVLTWGLNDCMRRGADSDNVDEVMKSVRPLLSHVRFATMSDQEMSDPEVTRYYKLLCAAEDGGKSKRTSILRSESVSTSSVTSEYSLCSGNHLQQRHYVPSYVCDLEIANCDTHSVSGGETFCLSVEMLKGRVFLTEVALAFEKFVNSKGNSCLYVSLSATNTKSGEQVSARGAYMISEEETAVKFPSALVVRESETVEMVLNVKRAVNICSMLVKDDSQIAITGDRKQVAMKIVPFPVSNGGGFVRSMFKGIKYFY